jgi:hypothetical protein
MYLELEKYVGIYKNALSDNLCEDIIKNLENCQFGRHEFIDYSGSYSPSNTDPEVYSPHIDPNGDFEIYTYEKTVKIIYSVLENYYKTSINFSWYNGWNGYTPLKFNKYTALTEMTNHCDHISDIFDGTVKGIPTLTVIGLLNGNFTGGEFVMFEDKVYELHAGDIIIFPSIFLYPHRVNPILSGIRYSVVSWVY